MADTTIEEVAARRVFTGRGDPTIEVEVFTADGFGRAAAPAGASKGRHEVAFLPEGGIDAALSAFERLVAPELAGIDAAEQYAVDGKLEEVDGTGRFEKIGGAVAVATSMAAARAAANTLGIPLFLHLGGATARTLPLPLGNTIGGGKHSRGLGPDLQEFLAIPLNPPDAAAAVSTNLEVHRRALKYIAKVDPHFTGGKNDEGAWTPRISTETALRILREAADEVSRETGVEIGLGVDAAASSLWDGARYVYRNEGKERTPREQLEYMAKLLDEFGLVLLEDPFHEDDFQSFAELTDRYRDRLIVGDDLYATNAARIEQGGRMRATTAVLIKPDQTGTLTRAAEAVRTARRYGMKIVASHRSGDTEYDTLAHVAVALGAEVIKTGIVGGERTAKLNELMRIGEYLGKWGRMASIK